MNHIFMYVYIFMYFKKDSILEDVVFCHFSLFFFNNTVKTISLIPREHHFQGDDSDGLHTSLQDTLFSPFTLSLFQSGVFRLLCSGLVPLLHTFLIVCTYIQCKIIYLALQNKEAPFRKVHQLFGLMHANVQWELIHGGI